MADTPYSPDYDDHPSTEYPPDWQARRKKVLERDGYACKSCSVESTRVDDVRFDVDHVVPKSDGGSHALDNLQTLCPSCHADKHPNNEELRSRAREYERRNSRSIVWRFIRTTLLAIAILTASEGDELTDEHGRRLQRYSLARVATLPDGEGVTVDVTVSSLWSSDSDSVTQMGEMTDVSAAEPSVRFVVWSGNDHPRLRAGRDYRVVGAKTNTYDGDPQLVIDTQTSVKPL